MPEEVINLPSSPETAPRPETPPQWGERRIELPEGATLARRDERPRPPDPVLAPGTTGVSAAGVVALSRPVNIKDIERVLSADLEDIYFQMPPTTQAEFKKKGEATALAVQTLLAKATVNVKKIAKLIAGWLKLIPGVNKFFLAQESKLRTDEVLKLKNNDTGR